MDVVLKEGKQTCSPRTTAPLVPGQNELVLCARVSVHILPGGVPSTLTDCHRRLGPKALFGSGPDEDYNDGHDALDRFICKNPRESSKPGTPVVKTHEG